MRIKEYHKKGDGAESIQLVFDSREEEQAFFDECCERIRKNTRWYLDNLETLTQFRVNWENYHKNCLKYRNLGIFKAKIVLETKAL
jgi:hypothetical protein